MKSPKKRQVAAKPANKIVGIGASAGGLEAFTELLRREFFVAEFFRGDDPQAPGCYLLVAKKMEDFVPDF